MALKGAAGQAARVASLSSKRASGATKSTSVGSSGSNSYSAPKPTTSTKYTFNIGGKTVNLTSDQLSKLAPESKNALMSKYKTGEASYAMDSGAAETPVLKSFEGKAADMVKQAYNKAVQAGTGSEFLKTTGAALKAKGYDLEGSLGLGVANDIATAETPIKPVIPIKTNIDTTPVLTTNKVDLSRINTVNAKAQLAAGNITEAEYNDVMAGKIGAGVTPPSTTVEPTEMQESTDNTQQLDLGNLGKFGADAATANATDTSFIDTRNQKIIEGLGDNAKDPAAVKAYLESQPGFKNASLSDQQNTINNIVQTAGGKINELGETTELPSVTDIKDYAVEANARDLEINRLAEEKYNSMVDERKTNMQADTFGVLDSTVRERFAAMNSNFQAVNDSISKLEETANSLFDVNKMIARQNQAKQLADSGILTGEQAASAASYSLQDYTMNVELQRAEIAKQMQEQMTNALKEKASMEDQILQQKGINAVTKQGMLDNINKIYLDIANNAQTNLQNANNKMDELITNANQTNIQVDLMAKGPLIQEKANQDLIGQKLQQANTNAGYRYQYVLDSITNLAPTLAGKAAALMREYQKNGTFMQKDAQAFVSELLGRLQSSGGTTTTSSSTSTKAISNTSSNSGTNVANTISAVTNPGYNPSTGNAYTVKGVMA